MAKCKNNRLWVKSVEFDGNRQNSQNPPSFTKNAEYVIFDQNRLNSTKIKNNGRKVGNFPKIDKNWRFQWKNAAIFII